MNVSYHKGDLVVPVKYDYIDKIFKPVSDALCIVVDWWCWEGEPDERSPNVYIRVLMDGKIQSIKQQNLMRLDAVNNMQEEKCS
ncbi:hypothetical protein OAA09_01135 [bacterium]|nr:hypothetical protein [bacterium]